MLARDTVSRVIAELSSDFTRVEHFVDREMNAEDLKGLYAALIAYALKVTRVQMLAEGLRECFAFRDRETARVRGAELALRAVTPAVTAALLSYLSSIRPTPEPGTLWAFEHEYDALVRDPSDFESLSSPLTFFQARATSTFPTEDLDRFETARRKLSDEKKRFDMLSAAAPWVAGEWIRLLADAIDGGGEDAPLGPKPYLAAGALETLLDGRAEHWFGVPKPPEVKRQLQAFHHWLLACIDARHLKGFLLRRYGQSVERFRMEWARGQVQAKPKRGRQGRRNADETALLLDAAQFLFLNGLEPFTEVQLASGRADLHVADREDVVVLEAKVIRPYERPTTIRSRVRDGLRQALYYCDRIDQNEGFLLVFWHHPMTPSITATYRESGTGRQINILIVDLGPAPTDPRRRERVDVQL